MGRRKKFLLAFLLPVLLVLVCLSATVLYLYHNPRHLASMMEKSLSSFTGARCTIKALSVSFRPLHIEAEGISLSPDGHEPGFFLEIPLMKADMSLSGPLGRRRLILKILNLEGPSLELFPQRLILPLVSPPKRGPSFLGRLLEGLVGLFLVSDVQFHRAEMIDGRITVHGGEQSIQVHGMHLTAGQDSPLSLTFSLEARWPSAHRIFTSQVIISTDQILNLMEPRIRCTITVKGLGFDGPEARMERMDVISRFLYDHGERTLDVESLNLMVHKLDLRQIPEWVARASISDAGIEKISLETRLSYDMGRAEISFGPLALLIQGISLHQGSEKSLPVPDVVLGAEGSLDLGRHILEARPIHIEFRDMLKATCELHAGLRSEGDVRFHLLQGSVLPEKGRELLPQGMFREGLIPFQLKGPVLLQGSMEGIRGEQTREWHGNLDARMDGNPFEILTPAFRLRGRIGASIHMEGRWPDLTVSARPEGNEGSVSARGIILKPLRTFGSEEDPWKLQAEVEIQDLAFQERDGVFMGEKISLKADISGRMDPGHSRISYQTSIGVSSGETLWDRFYLDLEQNPLEIFSKGSYHTSLRSLRMDPLRVELKAILPLEIQGAVTAGPDGPSMDLSLMLPRTALSPIFQHFLRDPFQTEKSFLSSLDAGGFLSGVVQCTGTEKDHAIRGHLIWNDGHLRQAESGIALRGIHMDFPIWYQSLGNPEDGDSLHGQLTIRSMTFPHMPEQALTMPMDVSPNRLSVRTPTRITVPGGHIDLGPIVINATPGKEPSLDTSLTCQSVNLRPLLEGMWTAPLEGTLSAEINPVHFEAHKIETRGEVKAKIFGGEILVSDLNASGILTAASLFRLHIQFHDLLLSEMTAGTSFGQIEGVLKGHVRDLEIAYGQPQKFDLLLETVKKEGVSQRMSIKAVDSITQMGGGQSPFMGLAGTLASLLKTFPYEKIGIWACLENDVFTVHGTIKEDNLEYLVKRGGFSGVNVVNQNPDNRISFKDMLKRIKRISTAREGPIVQ